MPEVYANAVKNGDHIVVTTDAAPGKKIQGTIVRNSDAIDVTNRTLNVEVDVDNHDHQLRPGQYAFVHLPLPPSTSSMTIDSSVLLFRSEGLRAAVVRNGKVDLVPVGVGHDYGPNVEIISGLSPDDQVIVSPSDSLAQGQLVHIGQEVAQ